MANLGSTGGWSAPESVTEKLKEVTIGFKEDAEHKIGHKFQSFNPTKFKFQVVAGVKYLVQVGVSEPFQNVVYQIEVEIFENLKGAFSFLDAYPLYVTGTKIKSHLYQNAGVPTVPAPHTPFIGGPGPVILPHLPLGPGPVVPPTSPTIPLGPGPVVPPIIKWKPVTDQVKEIAEREKGAIEALLKTKFQLYIPTEFAITVEFTTTTYYVVIQTGEFKYLLLGAPKVIKTYTEATILFSILNGQYRLVNAVHLDGLPPINPSGQITSDSGSGGQLQGPFAVTPELKDAVIGFKQQVEAYTGAKYLLFNPISYYSQVVAGTNYYVQTVVQNADGSQIVYPIYVNLFLSLEGPAYYVFKSAGQQLP